MKLIIDIDEELYKAYKGRPPMLGDAGIDMMVRAIANGIPYEEISADKQDSENIIRYLKQYSEIRQKVDEFHRKTTKEKPIETAIELQMYLKELESHERCLANQVLDIFNEVE